MLQLFQLANAMSLEYSTTRMIGVICSSTQNEEDFFDKKITNKDYILRRLIKRSLWKEKLYPIISLSPLDTYQQAGLHTWLFTLLFLCSPQLYLILLYYYPLLCNIYIYLQYICLETIPSPIPVLAYLLI